MSLISVIIAINVIIIVVILAAIFSSVIVSFVVVSIKFFGGVSLNDRFLNVICEGSVVGLRIRVNKISLGIVISDVVNR